MLVVLVLSVLVAATTSCGGGDDQWQSWAAKDAPAWDPTSADASGLCATLARAYDARAEFRAEIIHAADEGAPARALSLLTDARLDALDVVAAQPFVRAKSIWSLSEIESALFGAVYEPMLFVEPDLERFENDRADVDAFARSRCRFDDDLIEVASASDFLAELETQNQPVTVALPSNR